MTTGEVASDAPLRARVSDLPSFVGQELPSSRWLPVEQSRIDRFADATDDHQWIHVETARAVAGPYQGTVAHGFLTLSLIAPMLKDMLQVEEASGAFNYGLERVRFPAAVRSNDRVRAVGRVAAADCMDSGVRVRLALSIEIQGHAKPACVFELIVLYST